VHEEPGLSQMTCYGEAIPACRSIGYDAEALEWEAFPSSYFDGDCRKPWCVSLLDDDPTLTPVAEF
jgi:hypothetical protein